MSNLAGSLQSSLEQFVKPHAVRASFPIDRLINRLGFMTVIVQSVAILAANFAAQAKVSCAMETGDASSWSPGAAAGNATAAAPSPPPQPPPRLDAKAFAESYCYSRGVDHTDLPPDSGIPASFSGVLHHYMLQFYLPMLFLLQAGTIYLPYHVWSQTAGECLRENVQFVVELSKKLLADDDEAAEADGPEGHRHSDACRHRRMQNGRPSKADLLTDDALKRRLQRWYCKSKHTARYYAFQLARAVVLLAWITFYLCFPGFRHGDIRYRFVCQLEAANYRGLGGHQRFDCVLLQASLYEVGWSTNMTILLFCLLGAARQVLYFFPRVLGCRCCQCRTKRCLGSCGKECRSHYFQRILGLVVRPKRDPVVGGAGTAAHEGTSLLLLLAAKAGDAAGGSDGGGGGGGGACGSDLEAGCTDYYSHRLADRYFISQLCYENSHLLAQFIPDMAGANASDEISSLGGLASIAMKLDRRSEQLRGELEAGLGAAQDKAVAAVTGRKVLSMAAKAKQQKPKQPEKDDADKEETKDEDKSKRLDK